MAYPHPGWLLLNAEGTRFTKTKHEASVKFAEERGMVPLKYHLIPRTKGFTVSLPYLKGHCPAVYDINLALHRDEAEKATFSNLLNGRGITASMFVKRYELNDIPDDEEKASEWLHELFRRKDAMQESFHKHGNFFTGTNEKPVEPIVYKPKLACLINTVVWTLLTISFTLYYLAIFLLSGKIVLFSIGVGILVAFYVLMYKSISVTKISKASSYGQTSKDNSPKKTGTPTTSS